MVTFEQELLATALKVTTAPVSSMNSTTGPGGQVRLSGWNS